MSNTPFQPGQGPSWQQPPNSPFGSGTPGSNPYGSSPYGSAPGSDPYGSPGSGMEPQGYYGQGYPQQQSYPQPGGYPQQGGYPPQAPYGIDPISGLPYSDKSKLVAGLLSILLGGLGVGRFYTGHIGLGIAQLVVTVITFGVGVLWGVIDGIMTLVGQPRDARGRPLRP